MNPDTPDAPKAQKLIWEGMHTTCGRFAIQTVNERHGAEWERHYELWISERGTGEPWVTVHCPDTIKECKQDAQTISEGKWVGYKPLPKWWRDIWQPEQDTLVAAPQPPTESAEGKPTPLVIGDELREGDEVKVYDGEPQQWSTLTTDNLSERGFGRIVHVNNRFRRPAPASPTPPESGRERKREQVPDEYRLAESIHQQMETWRECGLSTHPTDIYQIIQAWNSSRPVPVVNVGEAKKTDFLNDPRLLAKHDEPVPATGTGIETLSIEDDPRYDIQPAVRSELATLRRELAAVRAERDSEGQKRKETAKDFETAFRLVRLENDTLRTDLANTRKENERQRKEFDLTLAEITSVMNQTKADRDRLQAELKEAAKARDYFKHNAEGARLMMEDARRQNMDAQGQLAALTAQLEEERKS